MNSVSARQSKNGASHPFLKKDPKPTRARLMSLLDPLGRKRYGEVERFLAGVSGASSGLHYYGTDWGWAVRYLLGTKNTLCTLHLLPNTFEATVALGKEMDLPLKTAEFSTDFKRKMGRCKVQGAGRCIRLPIKNDGDFASFQCLINLKAEALRSKKPAKAPKSAVAAAVK